MRLIHPFMHAYRNKPIMSYYYQEECNTNSVYTQRKLTLSAQLNIDACNSQSHCLAVKKSVLSASNWRI